ncbi:hypothetical protein ABZ923_31270 [Streptomyces sp. NPDC046881]|uniref:hypothetical protein n=1 Tax=Streptomyces sp. NPDC046881 TaxID=3155374 RepID=UPI0033FFB090
MIPQRIVLASAAGLMSALLLGACDASNDSASGAGSGAAPVVTTVSDPAASAPVSAPASGGDTVTVRAEAVKGAGRVVTDGQGMVLYRYGKDRPSPSRWTCAGACTRTWRPVIVEDSVRTTGVDKNLLGTVHRNGMKQLTLAGWPLYRYAGDVKAGLMNGQGKDKEWYAITPSGGALTVTG